MPVQSFATQITLKIVYIPIMLKPHIFKPSRPPSPQKNPNHYYH